MCRRRWVLGQESAEKWTAQADLQPGQPESDRLLAGTGIAQLVREEEDEVACGCERLGRWEYVRALGFVRVACRDGWSSP
jgi:hypothetical protein